MSARELDERQEALQRIDTLRSRPGPFWIEPVRYKRRGWLERWWIRTKALVLRPGKRV